MVIGVYAAVIIGFKLLIYGVFFGVMFVGVLFLGVVVLFVGILILCLKGDYFVVVILGVFEIICIFIINGGSFINGAVGILGIFNFIIW